MAESQAIFITGLKNAHAMETQALSIMRPQAKRIEHYPDVLQRLEQHIAETEGQLDRLERLLGVHGADKSMLKDAAMSLAGTTATMGHTMAGDEILKNAFANYAFEHYEIAAYKSLITLAKSAGMNDALPILQQNLDEEIAMAEWLDRTLEAVTTRFTSLREAGETAKH